MDFNTGEWSELYVLMKLLSEGRIDICDSNLDKIENVYYPIIKIFKESIDDNSNVEFYTGDIVKVVFENGEKLEIKVEEFIKNAEIILNVIKTHKSRKGAFDVAGIEEILNKIKIKVKGSSANKEDLRAQVEDRVIGTKPILTFSIKSKLGSGATILNASSTTNIKYNVSNLDKKHISSINDIKTRSKMRDRYAKIIELGGNIEYDSYTNDNFYNNLRYIDGDAPRIIAYLLLYYYKFGEKTSVDLINRLNKENPLDIDINKYKDFYKDKVIKVIKSASFGMMPGKPWHGEISVTGGLIIAKRNGEVVLLDKIYHEKEMDEYIFKNTHLETPSSTRYHMLELKEDDGKISFTLNLQIRFSR